jgi:DNA-binding response OmpR family regulator
MPGLRGSLERSAIGAGTPGRESGQRILVLDEHEGSNLVISCALTLLGHTCKTAESLTTAFALLPSFRPDIVIYEWMLQRANGVGLAARLRAALDACMVTPLIVVLSTQNEPARFREREHIDAYFTKPFHATDLEEILSIRSTPTHVGDDP